MIMVAKQIEEAFAELAKLPEDEQISIAEWLLAELSERGWQKRFAETGDLLDKLADEALKDYKEGRTEELDPDTL